MLHCAILQRRNFSSKAAICLAYLHDSKYEDVSESTYDRHDDYIEIKLNKLIITTCITHTHTYIVKIISQKDNNRVCVCAGSEKLLSNLHSVHTLRLHISITLRYIMTGIYEGIYIY